MLRPMTHFNRMVLVGPALLLALLAWDASGLDLVLAQLAGGAEGFALRHDWLLTAVLHDAAKYTAYGVVVALCVCVIWPAGPLRALPFARRLQLPVTALAATAAVSVLKSFSATSCPWDLAEFGGVARHVSHWSGWVQSDGGGGHCFPAGHAASGFAFIGGWFALRARLPVLARWWLATAIAVGLVLGSVQQLRGAHFMSHTLWTGWICWMVGWLAEPVFARAELRASQ